MTHFRAMTHILHRFLRRNVRLGEARDHGYAQAVIGMVWKAVVGQPFVPVPGGIGRKIYEKLSLFLPTALNQGKQVLVQRGGVKFAALDLESDRHRCGRRADPVHRHLSLTQPAPMLDAYEPGVLHPFRGGLQRCLNFGLILAFEGGLFLHGFPTQAKAGAWIGQHPLLSQCLLHDGAEDSQLRQSRIPVAKPAVFLLAIFRVGPPLHVAVTNSVSHFLGMNNPLHFEIGSEMRPGIHCSLRRSRVGVMMVDPLRNPVTKDRFRAIVRLPYLLGCLCGDPLLNLPDGTRRGHANSGRNAFPSAVRLPDAKPIERRFFALVVGGYVAQCSKVIWQDNAEYSKIKQMSAVNTLRQNRWFESGSGHFLIISQLQKSVANEVANRRSERGVF